MKKINITLISACTFIMLLTSFAGGIEVDIDEIRTRPVKFINYEGQYNRPDSIQDVGLDRNPVATDAEQAVPNHVLRDRPIGRL
jgi:hypothetical protein